MRELRRDDERETSQGSNLPGVVALIIKAWKRFGWGSRLTAARAARACSRRRRKRHIYCVYMPPGWGGGGGWGGFRAQACEAGPLLRPVPLPPPLTAGV